MEPFSLLIKPVSADCNMRCPYCFYLDRASLYPKSAQHRMSEGTLVKVIKSYMATDQPQYGFAWQGGEPTLSGVGFFRRAVELEEKYGRPGASVANAVQTNATLIDDDLACLFSEYRFLVGVSLDGPDRVHNRYRRFADGPGSYEQVMGGIRCLERNSVNFNILTLVSRANVKKGKEIYRFMRDRGFLHHQYIPCVEFDAAGQSLPWSIMPEEWGEFLCQVFDEWWRWDTGHVSIRWFDSLLATMVDGTCTMCQMARECTRYFVVEHNGDIYPCDFFVSSDLRLGNIQNVSWETLVKSRAYADFGRQKAMWSEACDACPYLSFCSGDCLKHRLFHGSGQARQLSWLCQGYKQFFEHALSRLETLADGVRRNRPERIVSSERGIYSKKPGRNEPCPCQSGLKYKRCCGI